MDTEIIYRLPSGKPVFRDLNHVTHKSLTVGELQNVAFHFYDQMLQAQGQMQNYIVGAPFDFNRCEAHYAICQKHYNHFNKLWRRASIAAKKTR